MRFYDRKTKKFYIRTPKLVHIGPIKKTKVLPLSEEDKLKIKDFVDIVEHLGTELGSETLLSTSDHDVFKIRDEINSREDVKIVEDIKKEPPILNDIDKIKKQLGL